MATGRIDREATYQVIVPRHTRLSVSLFVLNIKARSAKVGYNSATTCEWAILHYDEILQNQHGVRKPQYNRSSATLCTTDPH